MADVQLSTLGSVIKTAYEGEADTNAFTNAEQTKLAGIETAADVTDTANVTAAGALMDSEVTNLADVKAFDPDTYATEARLTVQNQTGSTITKGTPVYPSGFNVGAGHPEVTTADADGTGTMPCIGIAREDILNAASGEITMSGEITGIDTSGMTIGNALYVSTTGTLTETAPSTGTVQAVARVTRVDAANGEVIVTIGQSGKPLNDDAALNDVNDNEALQFGVTASAVNHAKISNAATGNGPVIEAVGDDANVSISITPKAAGDVILDGLKWPQADGTASQFLQTNGSGQLSWSTPAGSGDVSKVGTPVNNQIGVWTGDGTIEGDTALTFDTTSDTLAIGASGNIAFGAVTVLADSSGTTTLQNIDALDATSTSTVEAALVGQEHIWVPANAMTPQTTNGAAAGSVETTTNDVMIETLDFDAATDEFAQFSMQMPKSWDEGTLIVSFVWSHPSTTTNFDAIWGCQAVAFANDDALDTAWGTAVTVTDTGGTTDDLYITAETSAMTVAGTPGAEEVVYFRVYRDADNASDNLAVDARLHGVKIHWTRNALNED